MTSILAKVNPIWSKNQCLTNSIYSPLTPRTPTLTINSTEIVNKENGSLKAGFINNSDPNNPNDELFAIGPTDNNGSFTATPFTVDLSGNVTANNLMTESTVQGLINASITSIENDVGTLETGLQETNEQVEQNTTNITSNTDEITSIKNTYLPQNNPVAINQFTLNKTSDNNGINFSIDLSASTNNYPIVNFKYSPASSTSSYIGQVFSSDPNNKYWWFNGNILLANDYQIIFHRKYNNDTYSNRPNNAIIQSVINTQNNTDSYFTDARIDNVVPSYKLTEQRYALKSDSPISSSIRMYYSPNTLSLVIAGLDTSNTSEFTTTIGTKLSTLDEPSSYFDLTNMINALYTYQNSNPNLQQVWVEVTISGRIILQISQNNNTFDYTNVKNNLYFNIFNDSLGSEDTFDMNYQNGMIAYIAPFRLLQAHTTSTGNDIYAATVSLNHILPFDRISGTPQCYYYFSISNTLGSATNNLNLTDRLTLTLKACYKTK